MEASVQQWKIDIKGQMKWLHCVNICSNFVWPCSMRLHAMLLFADQLIWDFVDPYLWIVVEYHVKSKDS